MSIEKRGFKIALALGAYAMWPDGPKRGGHVAPRAVSPEDAAEHARAVAAMAELERNKYAFYDRDGGYVIDDIEDTEFVSTESEEGYQQRLREWWEGEGDDH